MELKKLYESMLLEKEGQRRQGTYAREMFKTYFW